MPAFLQSELGLPRGLLTILQSEPTGARRSGVATTPAKEADKLALCVQSYSIKQGPSKGLPYLLSLLLLLSNLTRACIPSSFFFVIISLLVGASRHFPPDAQQNRCQGFLNNNSFYLNSFCSRHQIQAIGMSCVLQDARGHCFFSKVVFATLQGY
ncbi:hypothetical protein IscW_ISCW017042 [Ixodes scapularis]|uniref:Uncharacterized protein n=1 Tax=Ixodes scapularis TaxID=6945 RepID=B7PDM9_IXOSC|nr:hypothetical protein IscW_ISCW017042 [Ixodes scapularis]|eukprot:XP_002410965.1 hypothetical protein IscW_ISCW017042 [Ixodes scapularis]